MKRILFAVVLVIMLFAGLLPSGLSRFKPAERIEGADPGLRFFGKSLVYTEEFPKSAGDSEGLTLSLEMTPFPQDKPIFGAVLTIFDKADRTKITIGQWNDSLMVLAGEDFSNKRREPKIYSSFPFFGKMRVDVVSDAGGTRLFIDGEPAGSQPSLVLKLPDNPEQSRLILGSGVSAWSPWDGILHSLEIYDSAVEPNSRGTGIAPLVGYRFDTGGDSLIPDETGHGPDLRIARQWIQLDDRNFRMPELHSLCKGGMPKDIALNYFGFIPFGFLLFKILKEKAVRRSPAGVALVLAASFLLSLAIESIQILMPSRDSSLLDLILNTLGGVSGGLLASLRKVARNRRRFRSEGPSLEAR